MGYTYTQPEFLVVPSPELLRELHPTCFSKFLLVRQTDPSMSLRTHTCRP